MPDSALVLPEGSGAASENARNVFSAAGTPSGKRRAADGCGGSRPPPQRAQPLHVQGPARCVGGPLYSRAGHSIRLWHANVPEVWFGQHSTRAVVLSEYPSLQQASFYGYGFRSDAPTMASWSVVPAPLSSSLGAPLLSVVVALPREADEGASEI